MEHVPCERFIVALLSCKEELSLGNSEGYLTCVVFIVVLPKLPWAIKRRGTPAWVQYSLV